MICAYVMVVADSEHVATDDAAKNLLPGFLGAMLLLAVLVNDYTRRRAEAVNVVIPGADGEEDG